MTLLLVWEETGVLYLTADTRLSIPGKSGGLTTLTDHGVKLVPFSVNCFGPSSDGFFNTHRFKRQFVLGFSGSTLVAQQAALAISVILGNLGAPADAELPSLAEISKIAAKLIEKYAFDIASMQTTSSTDCVIAGRCPKEGTLQIYRITTKASDSSSSPITASLVRVTPLPKAAAPLTLGDMTAQRTLQQQISLQSKGSSLPPLLPFRTIREIVKSSSPTDPVGGHLQFGWVLSSDYQPVSLVLPVKPGAPQAYFSNLGFDVFSLANPQMLSGWVAGSPGYGG